MMRALLLAALALAGCNDPTFTLRFRITDGLADACMVNNDQVTQCQLVPMSCAAVANVRVFNPNTPTSPVINVCQELMMTANPTLCEIAQVNLPVPTMPVEAQTLQVEILVYPKNKLELDANQVPVCPATVAFGADGFPAPSLVPCMPDTPCEPTPAVGGVAFYHPGDSETVVELGCADLKSLNEMSCTGTTVTATVTDFDTLVSVPASLAPQLTVSVGQPESSTPPKYALDTVTELDLDTNTGMLNPSWSGQPMQELALGCIQVDEKNVPARTDTVRCMPLPTKPINLVGTRLSKASLDEILTALGLAEFPDAGLVVGVVLDNHGNPAGGLEVTATGSTTIQYLAENRLSVGGSVTSTNGIFISQNAVFGTTFSATQSGRTGLAVSGLIDGKVTIVVLQIPDQTGA